jgi:hypothetical protein
LASRSQLAPKMLTGKSIENRNVVLLATARLRSQ